SAQSIGSSLLFAVQLTNFASRICPASPRDVPACGADRANSPSAFPDSQAERVQNVRLNTSAFSVAPYAPGARLTCLHTRGVLKKNFSAPHSVLVSKREAKTWTSVPAGGVFGTVQGRVGMIVLLSVPRGAGVGGFQNLLGRAAGGGFARSHRPAPRHDQRRHRRQP